MNSPISTCSPESVDSPSLPSGQDSARSGFPKSSHGVAASFTGDSRAYPTSETCEWGGLLPGFADVLRCSPEASPASPGAWQGRSMERMTPAISGRQCAALSRLSGPLGSLVRMCLNSSAWGGSTMLSMIWKTSVTPRNHLLFRLAPSARGISGSAYGLLPTPTVSGNNNRKDSSPKAGDGVATFIRRAMMFPTPLAADARGAGKHGNGSWKLPGLVKHLRMFPTPCAQDAKNSTLPPSQKDKRRGFYGTIPSALLNSGMPAGTPISAMFYEWLMGYPRDWTAGSETPASAPSATPSSRKSSRRSSGGSRRSKGGS